ncbi:hypothetical protein [Mesorhizobium sp. 1M-11]|uniref:hypothetical protein n=1 Tax=Mesorhizobium sp. 1M-11 TaxID=1529006 RepID=UPI000AA8DD93|nr:hypothetical protein [Mesorhizobium sp. 1M-11]
MLNLSSFGLLKNLRHGVLSRLWAPIAATIIRSGGPKVAARLTNLSIDRDTKSGPLILCLSRESFIKDIRELRRRTEFSYALITAGFTRFQMSWTPAPMQIQTFYQKYDGPGKTEALTKSTQYALQLIRLAGKKSQVRAVLSANFDYWQDAGFKQACKILNIPFIVLSREHPIIPKTCDIVESWYRNSGYHFDGAAIAVAGPSTELVLRKVGTVCRRDQVVITGLPRFDAWRDVDTSKPMQQRPLITLLTFTEGYFADTTFVDVLHAFSAAAKSHRDSPIQFLVKTKDLDDTMKVRALLGSDSAGNLVCDHEIDLFSALPNSRLVIGYNSLSLVEAAMARSNIVLPAWGECKDRGEDVMYPASNSAVFHLARFAYDKSQLQNAINTSINNPPEIDPSDNYKEFVNEYIYIPRNSDCSEQFESLVKKFI